MTILLLRCCSALLLRT